MSATTALGLGGAGVLLGVAIGCTGVGGVLLVPFLLYGMHLPVQKAIAHALYGYRSLRRVLALTLVLPGVAMGIRLAANWNSLPRGREVTVSGPKPLSFPP
jgi:hypothetical protein